MNFKFLRPKFTYTEVAGVLHNEGRADAIPYGLPPNV